VIACCHRGIQSCAGLLACVIVALFSASAATASTNIIETIAAPSHNDKSGLANFALQMVGQIQSQQQVTLRVVQDTQRQNAETIHSLGIQLKFATAIVMLLGAGLVVALLYVREALRSIQRRVRPLVPPPSARSPANGIIQRLASLLDTGGALLDLKQPAHALVCFEEALALDNHQAKAHVKKAAALEQLGRLDEALASYDHALALDDSLVDAYVGKGAVYNRLERYREALECYEHAVHLQPTINISQIHSLPRVSTPRLTP
jgi:tetratricopeptide (TPR) repeat protein